MWKTLAWLVSLIVLVVGFATFTHYCAIFVVPPVEAMPSGGTLIVWRGNSDPLLDSADAVCLRQARNTSEFCRTEALRHISAEGIMLRLPYIGMLDRFAQS